MFSHMNYIWSEEKSQFNVDTIQAILAVKQIQTCHVKHLVKNLHYILEY
jgi:hypothetical protein